LLKQKKFKVIVIIGPNKLFNGQINLNLRLFAMEGEQSRSLESASDIVVIAADSTQSQIELLMQKVKAEVKVKGRTMENTISESIEKAIRLYIDIMNKVYQDLGISLPSLPSSRIILI